MWYKFNPFEPSVRVPLVIRVPGTQGGRRVRSNCSLVDLLPTLLELASEGKPPELADHCDGRSLAALLRGADPKWPDEALARTPLTSRSAIVALTHDPKLDDPALIAALKSGAFYIGALGSRTTVARRTCARLAAVATGDALTSSS